MKKGSGSFFHRKRNLTPFSAVEAHPYFHGYELGPVSFVATYRSPLTHCYIRAIDEGYSQRACENLCAEQCDRH